MNVGQSFHYYIGLLLILVISAAVLGGCGSSKKDAFDQYNQSIQPIMSDLEKESDKWEGLLNKSRNGQIADIQMAEIIQKEMLPSMLKLQKRMEAIEPRKELVNTHEIGIKMIGKNVQGLNEALAALYNNDASKITSANAFLSEARELERKYDRQLEELAK